MNAHGKFSRRQVLTALALSGPSMFAMGKDVLAEEDPTRTSQSTVKVRRVRAIATSPHGIRLVVVKVETDEPELYGLGCATFNQRPLAVVEAVNKYLDPFARGRNAGDIEDMWQNA